MRRGPCDTNPVSGASLDPRLASEAACAQLTLALGPLVLPHPLLACVCALHLHHAVEHATSCLGTGSLVSQLHWWTPREWTPSSWCRVRWRAATVRKLTAAFVATLSACQQPGFVCLASLHPCALVYLVFNLFLCKPL